jgi:hypothetical protein
MDILGGPSCTRIKVDSLASFLDVDGGSGIAQLYGNGSYFFLQSADISALTPIFKFAGAKVAIGTSGGTYDVYLTRASASVLRLSSDGTTGAASLDVRGANFRAVTIRSGSASTGSTDYYVGYSGSGGHTETLPAATGSGRVLIFDHGGSGNWTIDGNAAETIDGAATVILTAGVKLMLIDAASGVWRSI